MKELMGGLLVASLILPKEVLREQEGCARFSPWSQGVRSHGISPIFAKKKQRMSMGGL